VNAVTHRKAGPDALPGNQRGAVLVLFVIAMLSILGIAGLALDGAHGMLNKTRLQNTVDAAALASAKALDQTADEVVAEAAALATFGDNASATGNNELENSYVNNDISVDVEFSNTLNPFAPGTFPAMYVRVRAQGFRLPTWLTPVLGHTEMNIAASAVAGPSPTISNACNLVPLIVCGTPPAEGGQPPYWGYQDGQPVVLKGASNQCPSIGPGNFQLARLGGSGADVVRENLAGGFQGCFSEDDTVPTQPGNQVGPVFQGLNTRFNIYAGPLNGSQSEYPPDVVTQQTNPPLTYDDGGVQCSTEGDIKQGNTVINDAADLDFNFDAYLDRVTTADYDVMPAPDSYGAYERRTMPVLIADCSGTNNGQSDLPVLGYGCFFLLQQAIQQGTDANIFGEFVEECAAQGQAGPAPTVVPGPYIIQLYKDFDSNDS